jgi:4-hydroxy-tetrahydrodipicolinate synthase
MSVSLAGTLTALYTPFTEGGELDLPALHALCERLVDAGSGLVPCGTTGETPTLEMHEYEQVVRTAVEVAAGRVPVVAGTGSNSTRKTIETTRLARDLGVDAALVVTPYYNKPPQSSLIAHFTAIAEDGALPLVLYNVPSRSGCNMEASTTLDLAAHPQILALKEASGSLPQMEEIIQKAPPDFHVLSGDDAWTLPLILMGGHGVISVAANVIPRAICALTRVALAGEFSRARRLQERLSPLFKALFLTTNPIPVKRAAAILGHANRQMRLPLTAEAMDAEMVSELGRALQQAKETDLES